MFDKPFPSRRRHMGAFVVSDWQTLQSGGHHVDHLHSNQLTILKSRIQVADRCADKVGQRLSATELGDRIIGVQHQQADDGSAREVAFTASEFRHPWRGAGFATSARPRVVQRGRVLRSINLAQHTLAV